METEYLGFKHLPIGILNLDLNLVITRVSDRFTELFSCTKDQLLSKNIEDIFSPKDTKGESRFYSNLVQYSEGLIDTQLSLRINDTDFLTRLRMMREEDSWVLLVEDLLSRNNLTFQLLWEEEKFSNIVKFSGEGIVILDENHDILEFNRKFFDFMDFRSDHGIPLSESALIKKNIFTLLGDSFIELKKVIEYDKQAGSVSFNDIFWHRSLCFEVKANPTFLPIKGFVGFCIVFKDVTAQKKLEKTTLKLNEKTVELEQKNNDLNEALTQLKETNNILDQINEEKNYLVNVVAHDLKSPLNHIEGLAEIIGFTSENLNQDQLDAFEKIKKAIERLKELIRSTLDLEAINSQKTNIKLDRVNLSPIVQRIIDTFNDQAAKKNINIKPEIELDKAYCTLDQNLFTQIMENLISNAIKYSPFDKTIFVRLLAPGHNLRVEVEDQGPGIKPNEMNLLFKKFQKLSATPTGGEQSTGLGLSIVKRYTDLMCGKVWCESENGFGAKFVLEFTNSQ